MKFPLMLILTDDSDIELFNSVEGLIKNVEIYDVGDFKVYDSDGYEYPVNIEKKRKLFFTHQIVTVDTKPIDNINLFELSRRIFRFIISAYGYEKDGIIFDVTKPNDFYYLIEWLKKVQTIHK